MIQGHRKKFQFFPIKKPGNSGSTTVRPRMYFPRRFHTEILHRHDAPQRSDEKQIASDTHF